MTVLHPMSAMQVARLASKLLNDVCWSDLNRVEAREIVTRMESSAQFGPAEGSPGARVLDAHARRLSDLANAAHAANGLLADGRDLSWLRDPAMMDEMARASFEY